MEQFEFLRTDQLPLLLPLHYYYTFEYYVAHAAKKDHVVDRVHR